MHKKVSLSQILKDLKKIENKEVAEKCQRFFKTGKGEYGEGDQFVGIRNPDLRKISQTYYQYLDLNKTENLLKSKIHEYRLLALFILVKKFEKAKNDEIIRKKIFNLYLKNLTQANNWDLIDSSAHKIIGAYLIDKPRDILYKLAKSQNLWKKRAAIMATFTLIMQNDYQDALKISEILLKDKHDLIHKAVGWMLREIGNRNPKKEETFLNKHYQTMPRTMLRYAIEKFPKAKREKYMKKTQ